LNTELGEAQAKNAGATPGSRPLGPRALLLPLSFAVCLAALALLPPFRQSTDVLLGVVGASAALCFWTALLFARARSAGRVLSLNVAVRKQHYLQACAQGSVLLYWGWYWPPVYAWLPFILAQLLFAYAFDLLLSWSRRDSYSPGFGQFPIVFSINLFLWFKTDWIALQFLMVGLGLAAKEFIRWNRDGRRVHIFNPSSFPLAVVSLVLLATHATGMTWGQEIATTQFYPPHMYLFLFLIGLPGQFFFGVTSMTMSAVLATYLFGRFYFAATGIYFFYDSYIPIAVFLGMHLLFTDPSTSPRSEFGRIIYGALYGLSTVALYQALGVVGLPTFYDKLLQVPLLNLMVQRIDRFAQAPMLRRLDPRNLGRSLAPRQRNLAYMSIWALLFLGLSVTRGVGDDHPGQWLPFWRQACDRGRDYACPYLADVDLIFCNRGSGWACNEAGLLHVALSRSGEDQRREDPAGAAVVFSRGCELGVAPACQNLGVLSTGQGDFVSAQPTLADYPIILRGSKGEIGEREPSALFALACRQGWSDACGFTSSSKSATIR
jgi:hypothetical protein